MDFASLMSAEISKSKKPSPNPPGASSTSVASATTGGETLQNKYVKRSEIEAARLAAYNAEQEAARLARETKLATKRKLEEEEAERNREREEKKRRLAEESRRRREEEEKTKEWARRRRLGLPDLPPKATDGENKDGDGLAEGEEDVEDEMLIARLREMGEPAKLFGESHRGRLRRWRRLVAAREDTGQKTTDGPIPTTLELLPEAEMKVPDTVPKGDDARRFLFRQLASYFTMVLKEWGLALARRDEAVKNSFQGKQAYSAMVQSRDNMRPFFKKFEKYDLEDGILAPVVEIVRAAQERRYVDGNDAYLRLSIGKAAWPIGVTMVGIHERSAREKLHESDNQAHIMSDEVTRKFLQSIKRCLSFAQTRWPPDDQLQLMG